MNRINIIVSHVSTSKNALISNNTDSNNNHSDSNNTELNYWLYKSKLIKWFRRPLNNISVIDETDRYYKGGILNMSYLCLDYHIENNNINNAIIYENTELNIYKSYTYKNLQEQVIKLAAVLKYKFDISKNDVVAIFLPMIPEAIIAMLAIARLGAIHCVIYSGFAGQQLLSRLRDADPKLILTCDGSYSNGKIIPLKSKLDSTLNLLDDPELRCLVLTRPELKMNCPMMESRDFNWNDQLRDENRDVTYERVDATHPLYLLFEAGESTKPLGFLRDHGSAVPVLNSMKTVFNATPGKLFFSANNIGSAAGHTYTVYGPLLSGSGTLLFEGSFHNPTSTNNVITLSAKYSVEHLYVRPSILSAIRNVDAAGNILSSPNLALKSIVTSNIDTLSLNWIKNKLPKLRVQNSWWQSELGWIAITIPLTNESGNLNKIPDTPVGSAGLPVPGFNIVILNELGQPVAPGVNGKICIKLPLPPGAIYSVWHNHSRFVRQYLQIGDYYNSGDGGYYDKNGFIFVTGRTDDILTVAGHRVSTVAIEFALRLHPKIAEAVVLAMKDERGGDIAVGFIALKSKIESNILHKECIDLIKNRIGPNYAWFHKLIVLNQLPKGDDLKLLRLMMRSATMETVANSSFIPSIINNKDVVLDIKKSIKLNLQNK